MIHALVEVAKNIKSVVENKRWLKFYNGFGLRV
jgi:hypothetical protein